MSQLTQKYRPTKWSELVGQEAVVKSLKAVLTRDTVRSILLIGDSGLGKTSVARIIAKTVGCVKFDLREYNAANNNGIDAMREIVNISYYGGFGGSGVKAIILDECHALSSQAWKTLLKPLEEPSEHVYWILCTTEAEKIPTTIETRCATFLFRPIKVDVIYDLLKFVAKSEGFKTPKDVLDLIARQSCGSPRRALNCLGKCYKCKTVEETLPLLVQRF